MLPHLLLGFPSGLRARMMFPQHLDHRDTFGSQLLDLLIQDLNRSFIKRQIWIEAQRLMIHNVRGIENIFSQHGYMKHVVNP